MVGIDMGHSYLKVKLRVVATLNIKGWYKPKSKVATTFFNLATTLNLNLGHLRL